MIVHVLLHANTIVVSGADGNVVYANRTVFDHMGISPRKLMESDFREQIYHSGDLERLRGVAAQWILRKSAMGMSFECGGTTATVYGF